MIVHQTKQPRTKPGKGQPLGFGRYFTDHMLLMDYMDGKGWSEPRIEPYGPIPMEPSSMVFHYGQALFEGLKVFRGYDGKLRMFRPDRHLARLNRSAKRICIPEVDPDVLHEGVRKLVELDTDWVPGPDEGSLYLRPFIIGSDPVLGVHASHGYKLMVIASPVGAYFANGFNPVRIMACTDYVRACPGGVGEAKVAANYAASLLAGEEAKKIGFDQVLWLDGVERRFIEEVGSMNIFFKIGDEVVTPALVGTILPGVTRLSVLELLKSWGMTPSERRISIEEVAEAAASGELKEIFGTGTAAVIAPVSEIVWGDRSIRPAEAGVGPITDKLYKTITGVQYGQSGDLLGWTEII